MSLEKGNITTGGLGYRAGPRLFRVVSQDEAEEWHFEGNNA